MIYILLTLLCLFLILLIFFQMPRESMGLTSMIRGSDILGSSTLIDKIIKWLIIIGIVIYVIIAFKLNLNINI